jgi:ribonuclease P protein component
MDFPKSARVRFKSEYLEFFKGSDLKRLGVCTLFRIPNQKNQPRIGITVKAKANSVYRNKLKRQIRECFRLNRKALSSFDYNIVIPSGVRVQYKTPKILRKQLNELWSHENPF